jgi:hypothetical protein
MNEVQYHDYSIGLDMPFWIQEFRTPKGKLIWAFEAPREVSYFFVAALTFILMFIFLTPVLNMIGRYTMSMPIILYVIVPLRIARLYCEQTPDGKKAHQFIFGAFRFLKDFGVDHRAIYQGERRKETAPKIIFEKTQL